MPSGHSLSCNSGSTASAVFRWLPLVKWLLAIPHYVLLVFLWIVAVLSVIIRGRRRDFGATRCHPTISKVGADGHRQQRCAPDGDVCAGPLLRLLGHWCSRTGSPPPRCAPAGGQSSSRRHSTRGGDGAARG